MSLPIDVVLVGAPACHYCDDAQAILDDLGTRIPMTVRKVDLLSDEGRSLAVTHRIAFPPLLMVAGEYFGYGRISRRKLEKHLAALNITVEVT
ncbi:MAG: glutaredoxin [Actinobacteria bacterium HGW-Actinobacteria-4]|nr:MAG: glutaredoxin [Actinobacteria bacterium HGW-Actinobacteria-4]